LAPHLAWDIIRTTTNEFISGGYFVIRRADRPKHLSPLVPETFVTLSSCLTDVVPDLWTVDWENYSQEERAEEAAKFGIPSSAVPHLVEWVTPRVQFPFGFPRLEDALRFHGLFRCDDLSMVVGIGLHSSLVTSFKIQLEKESNRGLGLLERIERKELLAEDGTTLGYEPLGFDAMNFHSWLCSYSPEALANQTGIQINENGLLSTLDDGIRTTGLVREEGEQAIWEPWLVVSYATQKLKQTI
jgi:hypothetical protein